jgi:imidazolonepropionase-like amidohydrolase
MNNLNKVLIFCALILPLSVIAQEAVLISNADLFDSVSGKLVEDVFIRIEGNRIAEVSDSRPGGDFDREIDAGGNVLLPGFIDTHVHMSIIGGTDDLGGLPWDYLPHKMAKRSSDMLLRGFTTVRDLGGPVFGLRRAIEEGLVDGPRIFPSGAFVSQTSGHGDFRSLTDANPQLGGAPSHAQKLGYYQLADGVPAVLTAVRENLKNGATQIKVMGSGGVASAYDPGDSIQYTPDELRAAVQAASDWGTYVASHLHNAPSIIRALEAGVMSVEHGFMMDEQGAKLMVKKGAFLSTQFAILDITLDMDFLTEAQLDKARIVIDAAQGMVDLVKKHGVKITFSSDSFGPDALAASLQTREFEARARQFSNVEVLQHATINSAELVELSGNRNPYPGRLGVIEKGAMADILIVNGNPLEDISLLGDPDANLLLIMKDGKIYKNTLAE